MTLRQFLQDAVRMLDEFNARAGRKNATVIAIRDQLSAHIANDDRVLDVEDPSELQRGAKPAPAEPVAEAGDSVPAGTDQAQPPATQ